jgi:hypothetical protein
MEDNPWTEALVAELRSLVGQDVPYSMIARQLGVSRNAAIGKAKRLKISMLGDAAAGARRAEVDERRDSIAIDARPCLRRGVEHPPNVPPRAFRCEPIPPAISSDPLNLRMDQLKFFHCRYITNDHVREPTYCGRHTVEGTSWCAFHLARVRAPVPSTDVPLVPSLARTRQPQT